MQSCIQRPRVVCWLHRDSSYILLPRVVLRASHSRALHWFPAGLLDIVLSCSTQKKKTHSNTFPGSLRGCLRALLPFFFFRGWPHIWVGVRVSDRLTFAELPRTGRSIKIGSEKSGKWRDTTASSFFCGFFFISRSVEWIELILQNSWKSPAVISGLVKTWPFHQRSFVSFKGRTEEKPAQREEKKKTTAQN